MDEAGDALAAGTAAGAAGTDDTTPAADVVESGGVTGTDAGDTSTAAVTPEPTFDPRELQAELDYLRQQNQQLTGVVQQIQAPGPQQTQDGGPPDYDPFDPQSVQTYMAWERQQTLNEMRQLIQPVSQTFEQQQQAAVQAAGEELIADMIADDAARNGEFVPGDTPEHQEADRQARQLVSSIAEQLFPDYAARYGQTTRAGEFAIEKAAAQVRALLKAAGESAVARHTNRSATLAGARSEPAPGAAAVAGQPVASLTNMSIAHKYARA